MSTPEDEAKAKEFMNKISIGEILTELEHAAKLIQEKKTDELYSIYGTMSIGFLISRLKKDFEWIQQNLAFP